MSREHAKGPDYSEFKTIQGGGESVIPMPFHFSSLKTIVVEASLLGLVGSAFSTGPVLSYYQATDLSLSANVSFTEKLIDRAAAAGYTNLMLEDVKLNDDGRTGEWADRQGYKVNLRAVIKYASQKGIKVIPLAFEFGRANWILAMAQNWVESQKVTGANYKVSQDGKSLVFQPENPVLVNPGFENGTQGWTVGSPRVMTETSLARVGGSSLKFAAGLDGAYCSQVVSVLPNRQYHVGYWVRTQGFAGKVIALKITDPVLGVNREGHEGDPMLAHLPTQGWTHYDFVFNSGSSTSVKMQITTWGPTQGTAWFDGITIEEIGLHNVVRNSMAPLRVYLKDGTNLIEGQDFDPIEEPFLAGHGTTFQLFRTPLTPTIPAGSSLRPGQRVQIDYDAAQPIHRGQYAVSLSEPAVKDFYKGIFYRLRNSFGIGSSYMFSGFDEIRMGNTATVEQKSGLVASRLLSQAFLDPYNFIHGTDPAAQIYVWSDMFDPLQNAVANYYLWRGDLRGSWLGLPKDVIVVNWNLANLAASLRFFSNLGNPQIIAGYYDSGDGYQTALTEVKQSSGISGVRGAMYTTWVNDYSQLENFAKGILKAWPNR
jgi:hypothetical protein